MKELPPKVEMVRGSKMIIRMQRARCMDKTTNQTLILPLRLKGYIYGWGF
jgi:hypothetical protein